MSKTERGVALITGASSGYRVERWPERWRACYRVFGTSRKPMADTTNGVTMLVCDVTDEASVHKVVDDVLTRAGRIDLLVNNAGLGLLGGAEESSASQAKALFDERLRCRASDECGPACDEAAGKGPDHQYEFHSRAHSCPVQCALRIDQACDRGVHRIARSRR